MRILIAILGLTVIGQIMDGDTVAFSLDGIDAPENGPATPHKCVPVPFDDRAVGDGSSANRMDGPENGPVRALHGPNRKPAGALFRGGP